MKLKSGEEVMICVNPGTEIPKILSDARGTEKMIEYSKVKKHFDLDSIDGETTNKEKEEKTKTGCSEKNDDDDCKQCCEKTCLKSENSSNSKCETNSELLSRKPTPSETTKGSEQQSENSEKKNHNQKSKLNSKSKSNSKKSKGKKGSTPHSSKNHNSYDDCEEKEKEEEEEEFVFLFHDEQYTTTGADDEEYETRHVYIFEDELPEFTKNNSVGGKGGKKEV